jgi:hypothetical protein
LNNIWLQFFTVVYVWISAKPCITSGGNEIIIIIMKNREKKKNEKSYGRFVAPPITMIM